MTRPPASDDLYRLRIPTDPRLAPGGGRVAFTVQVVAAGRDGYRHAIWGVGIAAETGAGARANAAAAAPAARLTIGSKHDTKPRFAPDGRTLAFLSDRRLAVEEDPEAPKDREDGVQVHLLSLDRGEARRLTDLPRGVDDLAWSPDGRSLVVATASRGATRKSDAKARGKSLKRDPGSPPTSDYRYIDRLQYLHNGPGFVYDRIPHLWLVDAATGEARRLTGGPTAEEGAVWSPDGTRIAFAAARGRNPDLDWQFDIFVVDVATGAVTRVTDGRGCAFGSPAWLPDGRTLAVLGHRFPVLGASRNDVWLFPADGSEAHPGGGRNLSGRHDLMPGSGMGSDIQPAEAARLLSTPDGSHLLFTAPVDGSYELWRIAVADGAVERLTEGRHYISGWDAIALPDGGFRVAVIRSSPTELGDIHLLDLRADGARPGKAELREISGVNDEVLAEIALVAPEERRVDGRRREHPGLASPCSVGRRRSGTARHGDPRRTAHPLRLGTGLGVPGPRRGRDERPVHEPAGLRGLWPGLLRRLHAGLGRRADARRPRPRRCGRG